MTNISRRLSTGALAWFCAWLCMGCGENEDPTFDSLCIPAPAVQIAHSDGTLLIHSEAASYVVEYVEHQRQMWILCEADLFTDPVEAPDQDPMAPRICGWSSSAAPGEVHELNFRVRHAQNILVETKMQVPAQQCLTSGRKDFLLTLTD